jgi:hypothetical protein
MFDPRNPYERCYWHYDSRRPLSIAQLIALKSIDVETAALVWLLLERGASFIIAGPTDPKPGVGKTTVLNALFQFLPKGISLVYTSGMYEDFAFTHLSEIDPATTYVLCNEVSDHQPFYMWGRVARQFLMLPTQGYHIATSIHADTIDDTIYMFHHELRLSSEAVRRLGLVVHTGIVDQDSAHQLRWQSSPRRRWLSAYFIRPKVDPLRPDSIIPIPISLWNAHDDSFEHADQSTLDEIAEWAGLTCQDFATNMKERVHCLQQLALRNDVSMDQMYDAITELREGHKKVYVHK